MSEQISNLVIVTSSLALMRETFSKLSTVALALLLERNEITNPDTSITTNTMRQDFSAIKQFVQMRAAHAKALSSLTGSDRLLTAHDDDLITLPNATDEAQQEVAQLRSSLSRARELVERVKLVERDLGGLKSLHATVLASITNDVDVTDDASVKDDTIRIGATQTSASPLNA